MYLKTVLENSSPGTNPMYSKIEFLRSGYENKIDYLKGISIIFVILTHSLPFQDEILFPIWGGQAVPILLIIQALHYFRKGIIWNVRLEKLWKRIIFPFLIQNMIVVLVLALFSRLSLEDILSNMIYCGGNGPGSYYVWIYLQFVLLLPIYGVVYKWTGTKGVFILAITLSWAGELLASFFQLPNNIYRLFCGRYLFLPFIGLIWARYGIVLNIKTIFFSILGLISILLLHYSSINLSPFICPSDWTYHHWICYPYAAFLFPFLLLYFYKKGNCARLCSFLCKCGKCSYEIFLWQMVVFKLFSVFYNHDFINHFVAVSIKIPLTILLSLSPVFFSIIKDRRKSVQHL